MNALLEFQSTLTTLEETNSKLSKKSSSFQNYLNSQRDKIWRKHYPKKKKIKYDLLNELEEYKNFSNKIKDKLAPKFWNF